MVSIRLRRAFALGSLAFIILNHLLKMAAAVGVDSTSVHLRHRSCLGKDDAVERPYMSTVALCLQKHPRLRLKAPQVRYIRRYESQHGSRATYGFKDAANLVRVDQVNGAFFPFDASIGRKPAGDNGIRREVDKGSVRNLVMLCCRDYLVIGGQIRNEPPCSADPSGECANFVARPDPIRGVLAREA